MTPPPVLGIDQSYTATGIAWPDGTTTTLKWPPHLTKRLDRIYRDMRLALRTTPGNTLVAMEGYSYGSKFAQKHKLGELGAAIKLACCHEARHYIAISPASVKKLATGKGNAGKAAMLNAAKCHLGYDGKSADEADALWLRAYGLALIGHPIVDLPATHTIALEAEQQS